MAVMQRTKRSPGNVFQEAYKAYERRQAAISAMRGGAGRPKIDWDFWGTGSLEKEERVSGGVKGRGEEGRVQREDWRGRRG